MYFTAARGGISVAFSIPNFNLLANVWRNNGVGKTWAAPDLVSACNLSPGRRVNLNLGAFDGVVVELLMPKLVDVRAAWNGVQADVVEVPAGSRRAYFVFAVDDVGKGFSNEYRLVWLVYQPNGNPNLLPLTAAPVPLP